jgi:hypothetical protein
MFGPANPGAYISERKPLNPKLYQLNFILVCPCSSFVDMFGLILHRLLTAHHIDLDFDFHES